MENGWGCCASCGARKSLDAKEKKLLHALASHAALSLENFRRFSQLEKSKRQWVEDIDAISDYIVVHDRAWKILRTNRSLASHLGVPPVALVGEAMSGLRQIAETGAIFPALFAAIRSGRARSTWRRRRSASFWCRPRERREWWKTIRERSTF